MEPMTNTDSPTDTIVVRLVGGPAFWHQEYLTYTRAEIEDVPFEDLGAYLKVPEFDQLPPRPEHEDPNPDAHYAPVEGGPRDVWFFQSWVPWSDSDPSPGEYLREHGTTS